MERLKGKRLNDNRNVVAAVIRDKEFQWGGCLFVLALVAAFLISASALAQSYPTKAIKMIVPFPRAASPMSWPASSDKSSAKAGASRW